MSKQVLKSAIGFNLLAIAVGIALGQFLGKSASDLGFVAWFPVAIMKGLASPLLFLAILHGLMSDQISGRGAKRLVITCAINAFFAVTIAMILVHLFKPGAALESLVQSVMRDHSSLNSSAVKTTTWIEALKALVPESVIGPFVSNNIPAILILSLLAGYAVRRAGQSESGRADWFFTFRNGIENALSVVAQMMSVLMKVMPLAICASVAKATGEHGIGVFKGLGWYVLICIGGMVLQVVLVYHSWIRIWAKKSIREFWHYAQTPVIFAFGVNSSLASLPSTLTALNGLNVSSGASRLGACIGTNLNNDGILLYEVAALMMLGQAAGFDWTLGHQLWLALVCVLATFGVGGFPEAGVIALSLVLSTAGLPVELLPLLLPVDWLVARVRSATNVVSDMTVSIVIDSDKPEPNVVLAKA